MKESKNTNLSLNPTLHQKQVRDMRPKRNGKTLNVAILGIPNSGKSTLVNQIVGREVCPTSCKHNTTRRRSRAIYTVDDTQIVFLDTPGVVSLHEVKKFGMEDSLFKDPEMSCREADILLVIHDVSNRYVREALDKKVLRLLCKYQHKVPCILVLNKMDTMPKKRRILDLISKLTCNRLDDGISGEIKISSHEPKWNVDSYMKRAKRQAAKLQEEGKEVKISEGESIRQLFEECSEGPVSDIRAEELTQGLVGWPGFRDVFCISAVKGDGVADIKSYILHNAKPGGHRYSADLIHDQDPRQTVIDTVKSKLLDNLHRETPYKLEPVIQFWQYDEELKTLGIGISIQIHNSRQARLLIGPGGKIIANLSNLIEASLMDYFGTTVKLKLEARLPKQEEDSFSFDAIRLKPDNSEAVKKDKDFFLS